MKKLKNSELGRLSVEAFKQTDKTPFAIVLDNVRSAHNVGSIFRTSDAFLVAGIYLCGITPIPPNKEIRKTALGASDSLDWYHYTDTKEAIKVLREAGYQIIAIEQAVESISLDQFEIQNDQAYAFIFGHEVKGVSQEVMEIVDACIEIPQLGTKHSFNISVSSGIVLWDLHQKYLTSKNT